MTHTLTWLHLSDLHSGNPNSAWAAPRVLDELVADLKRLQDRAGRPDLIFFTGDVAWGHVGSGPGQTLTDQFQLAKDTLETARRAFTPEVPANRVFLLDFCTLTTE